MEIESNGEESDNVFEDNASNGEEDTLITVSVSLETVIVQDCVTYLVFSWAEYLRSLFQFEYNHRRWGEHRAGR